MMTLTDSRRLTGPNLILDSPGAAAELQLPMAQRDDVVTVWREHARKILDAVEWTEEVVATRVYEGGVTLAISAPMDALDVATEIVEAAWDLTEAELSGEGSCDFNAIVNSLKSETTGERNPTLLALNKAADEHGITLVPDDETITLGLGVGSLGWPSDKLPKPNDVEWGTLFDIPVALVTGTNGKSTTVRIAASIGDAAGLTVGFSSSDWVKAGDVVIATGDYSGPEGSRLALRDKRVNVAVIETARGGLLRRGLPVSKASACLITNIAADHLGEYGIQDVEALADTKFTVSKAVQDNGVLILNADDPRLKTRGEAFNGHVAWYGLSLTKKDCRKHDRAAFVVDGLLTLFEMGEFFPILPVVNFKPGLGGAATYNVSNALGAILLMSVIGCEPAAIKQGLLNFGSNVDDNPGRGIS